MKIIYDLPKNLDIRVIVQRNALGLHVMFRQLSGHTIIYLGNAVKSHGLYFSVVEKADTNNAVGSITLSDDIPALPRDFYTGLMHTTNVHSKDSLGIYLIESSKFGESSFVRCFESDLKRSAVETPR